MTHARVLLAAGVSLALAAACHQDELFSPRVPPYAGGAMFQRYVSMGNSFTMGIQSGGINDSTQRVAYPVLVAGAMSGDPFYYPSLTIPGCPPPYTNIFTGARVGTGSTGTTCLFRSPSIPPYLSNVAVSGAWAIDLSTNGPIPGTHSNALTQLVLGGRTQLQAMMAARPTFVSVWIGDNDLVQAAFANDTTLLTDTTTFKAQYRQVLDSIQAVGAQALLIGVGEGTLPTTIPPFFSRGSTYYLLFISGAFAPAPFTVLGNCAPPRGDTVGVAFPYGLGLIGTAKTGTPTTLDCTAPQTVQPASFRKYARTQVAYNAIIQTEATARGWAYLSLNAMFDSLQTVPPAGSQIAPFPNANAACSGSPFGLAFSCDGFHMSTATHRLIAKKIVQAINGKYGSAIPAVVP